MQYDDKPTGSGGMGGPNSRYRMALEGRWYPVCRVCHQPATRKLVGAKGRRTFYCKKHGPQIRERWRELIPLTLRDAIDPAVADLPPEAAPQVPHKNGRLPVEARGQIVTQQRVEQAEPDTGSAMHRVKRALDDLALENSRLREQVVGLEREVDGLRREVAGWEAIADQITRPDGQRTA